MTNYEHYREQIERISETGDRVAIDKDTNEILKFGETLNPEKRYSQKYLNENNAVMKVIESGSKRDIHMWQYDMNKYYESKYGEFPPLLKSKGW